MLLKCSSAVKPQLLAELHPFDRPFAAFAGTAPQFACYDVCCESSARPPLVVADMRPGRCPSVAAITKHRTMC